MRSSRSACGIPIHGLHLVPRVRGGLALVLAAFLFGVPSARAQLPVKFSIAGGWNFPAGPASITDFWTGGGTVAAGLSLRASSRVLAWAEVGYYRLEFDADAFESTIRALYPDVNVSGNDLQVIPVTVGAAMALTGWGNTRPYVTAGLGYYSISVTSPQTSGPGADDVALPDPSDDAFGACFGFGVRTLVTPAATLFFDVTYHAAWASSDALGFVPLRVGLRF